jgi:serine/threonine protein kinase
VVERRIGEGGQAAVYQVLDTRLSVRRAIKILLPHAAEKQKLRNRFVAEAKAMALLDHPHIARVYDVNSDTKLPYLVMELVTGGTLADWQTQHGRMPPRLAANCTRQVALAVVAAHAAGVIHRDIKPQNVLVTADGSCKLTDFGIARMEDNNVRTRAGAAMGTQGYMAPEQAKDASTIDVRVDVFSLGMLLFALVTNEDPLVRLAGRGLDHVPAPLRSLIDRATSFDRERRQSTAQQFLVELGEATSHLPPDPPTPPLASTEVEGESVAIDGAPGSGGEDSTLYALSKMSATPAPVRRARTPTAPPEVRPYTMPRQAARGTGDATPDWIDRSRAPQQARVPVEITVGTPPPPKRVTNPPAGTPAPASRANKTKTESTDSEGERDPTKDGLPEEAVAEAKGFVDQILTTVVQTILDPWRVALPALIFVLLIGAFPVYQTRHLRRAAEEVRAARAELHQTFLEEKPLIDELNALGAEPSTLETLHGQWAAEEREPQKTQAIERFLSAVDNELRFRAAPGLDVYESAKARVGRIRTARAAYATEMREFDALTAGGFSWGIEP